MKKWLLILVLFSFILIPASAEGNQGGTEKMKVHFSVLPVEGPESTKLEIKLSNVTNEMQTFNFPTSQMYEISIRNSDRVEVYRYSKGRSFLQALQNVSLKPGETKTWHEKWTYMVDGKRVLQGDYLLEVWLTATHMNGNGLAKRQLKATSTLSVPTENPVFRHVETSGEKWRYTITGEIKSSTGEFYYSVEDGHNELIPEKKVELDASPGVWTKFEVQIVVPEGNLPDNGSLILFLYERNKPQDGEIVHGFPVILETFKN
jgi:hypothetical protein